MPRLPLELSDYIIDFLHEDPSALSTCALTCRAWTPASRYHLFRAIVLQNRTFTTPFQRLLSTSPDLGWYVRELTVAKFVDTTTPSSSCTDNFSTSAVLTTVERALPQIFAHLPNLHTLTLTHVDVKCLPDLKGLQHPAVRKLDIAYCQFAELADIVDLVGCFPNLASLALAGLTWREETRISPPKPLFALRTLALGRDVDSEGLYAWLEAAGVHSSIVSLSARCATKRDTDLVGPFIKLAGASLQSLDLDWSVPGDKTIVLPETMSLGACTALETLALRFPVQYSTTVPWVTALLASLGPASASGSVRSVACDISLLGSIDALDWHALAALLASDAFRSVTELAFAVNVWAGVHKDFEEVEDLVRARLAAFEKRGVLRVTRA